MALSFLLVSLVAVAVFVGSRWSEDPTTATSGVFGGVLLMLVVVYAVGVLEWDIAGASVTVKAQVQQAKTDVLATKDEVSRLAAFAVKAAYLVAAGDTMRGLPQEYHAELKKLVAELGELTKRAPGELQAEFDATAKQLDWEATARRRREFTTRWRQLPRCDSKLTRPCTYIHDDGTREIMDQDLEGATNLPKPR